MTTEIARVSLPCSVAALERAILHAAHQGHWHVAQVKVEDDQLVIYYSNTNGSQTK